ILDVGCAQGTLALLLAERGHRVWALDIRQDFLDYAVSRHERGEAHFVCGNVLEVELEDRFDLIFCNQTIEHLVHPEKLIRRLHQWLVQAGRLVVTTPNGLYLKNSLPSFSKLGDVSQYEDRQYFADGDGHFFAYHENELLEIFRNSGFRRVFVKYFETPWISGHMKIRYLHSILPATMLQMMDGMTLNLPGLSKRLTHQLLVVGHR
ncbi:MAG TPA: class I SAM-dependent methyltransferase, partial [Acidobacteriota bacterium]